MQSLMIEGYASLFRVEDLAGDVVRAGAFARTLAREARARRTGVGMQLSHVGVATAERWTTIREDGCGLFVRGLVSDETMAGATALKMIGDGGVDGLSIGFVARDWSPRVMQGAGPEGDRIARNIASVGAAVSGGTACAGG